MVSEKVYGKQKKTEISPIMSSDDSDIEVISYNPPEQPFNTFPPPPPSTSTFGLIYDASTSHASALGATSSASGFTAESLVSEATIAVATPEVPPTIPTPPLIASPLPKKAAFTSFDESLANPYGLGRKYTF